MWEKIQARLIEDWQCVWMFWSARLNALGMIIYPMLIAVQAMPPEIQAILPLKYRAVLAGLYAFASLIARVIVQPKLDAKRAGK